MITFQKVKNYKFLGSETVRPREQYKSVQTDEKGKPLYYAIWLGIEDGRMIIRFKGEIIGFATSDQGWRNFIQDHAKANK
jgi:hypothetical protein